MHKLLTGFIAASAFVGCAAAAKAECVGNHKVTASVTQAQDSASGKVEESTEASAAAPKASIVAQATVCADGEVGCAEATNPTPQR